MNYLVKAIYISVIAVTAFSSAEAASKVKLHPGVDDLLVGDTAEGVAKLSQASDEGNSQATAYLAIAYNYGWGVRRDAELAKQLAEKAASEGVSASSLMLFVEFNSDEALSELKKNKSAANKLAKKGDLLSMYYVAIVSEQDADAGLFFRAVVAEAAGVNLADDSSFVNSKSKKYYKQSAESGFAPSMHRLAALLQGGQGFKENMEAAVSWHQKARERNYPPSIGFIGAMHSPGQALEEDIPLAVELLEDAVDKGDPWSTNWLGVMYRDGNGVKQDSNRALDLFAQALSFGSDDGAQNKSRLEAQLANETRRKAYDEQAQLNAQKAEQEWDEAEAQCFNNGPQRYAQGVLQEARQLLGRAGAKGAICEAYTNGWYDTYYRWKDQHRSFSSMMIGPADSAWCTLGVSNKQEVNLWKIQMPGQCR